MGRKVLTGKPRIDQLMELIREIEITVAAPHDSIGARRYAALGAEEKAAARIALPILSRILGDLHSKLKGKHELTNRQIENEMYNSWRSVMEQYILKTGEDIVRHDDAIVRESPAFEEFRYDPKNEGKSAVGLVVFAYAGESLGQILEAFNHLVKEEKQGGRGRGGSNKPPSGKDD